MVTRAGKITIGHHWPVELHDRIVKLVGPRRVAAFTRESVDYCERMRIAEVIEAASAVTGGAPRKHADAVAEDTPAASVVDGRERCPTHNRLPVSAGRCPQCNWKPAATVTAS